MATEKPTTETGFSVEDDLDKAWADAIVRINGMTGWNLSDEKDISIDDVLMKLKAPKEKSQLRRSARMFFHNALLCVQKFGQVAANTAGTVFGPSQQCFNAINLVITAIQDYDAVFENIVTLMERISVFMNRLKIIIDMKDGAEVRLDMRLRCTVYKVLEHFLTVLGTSHKLTQGWKAKLKLAVEIGAFGDDKGIKDAMAKLETLIVDETGYEISSIFADLSEAAQNIRGMDMKVDYLVEVEKEVASVLRYVANRQEQGNNMIVRMEQKTSAVLDTHTSSLGLLENAERQRKADEQEKKRLADIRETLAISEGKYAWTEKQDELDTRRTPGSGMWLLNLGIFSRWADGGDNKGRANDVPAIKARTNVLSLRAGEGYGKTYLCSLVVRHLLEKYGNHQRTSVAYHYFESRDKDAKRGAEPGEEAGVSDGNIASLAVKKALREIIYQLAAAKTPLAKEYSKLVHQVCSNRTAGFEKSKDLWQSLVTDLAKTLEGSFYLILDGIDETDGELGQPLAQIVQEIASQSETSPLKIRLFFTGRPEGLDQLVPDGETAMPAIIMPATGDSYANRADLMLFAEQRLKDMDMFRGGAEAELKEKVKSKLVEAVHGDYSSLNIKLGKIRQCRSNRDVERELDFAGESKAQGVKRVMDALNATLEAEEVQELNHLLSWEAACWGHRPLEVYEQYLRLQPPETRSLVPLRKQITERYSTIFDIDESGTLTLKTDEIRDYLDDEDDNAKDGADRSTPQEGEVNLVRSLLRTHLINVFGSHDTYERFGFAKFFEAKLQPSAPRIRTGSVQDCELRALVACLAAMCDHCDDEAYSALRRYAESFFIDHMMEIDVGDVDEPTLRETGRRLVRILHDPDIIDQWWDELVPDGMRKQWVYENAASDTLFTWLANPAVQAGLANLPSQRQWVRTIAREEGPHIRVLSHVAKRIAERWFSLAEERVERRGGDRMLFISMHWLHGYLSQSRGEAPSFEHVGYEDICKVEMWARDTLANDGEKGKWHACVGRTCEYHGLTEQAAIRYRQAVDLLPDSIHLRLRLAQTLGRVTQHALAVKVWEDIVLRHHGRMIHDVEFRIEYMETIFDTMFFLITDCHVALEIFEKTTTAYEELLRLDWKLHLRLAEALAQDDCYCEAETTLEDLMEFNQARTGIDEVYRTAYYETILHSAGEWQTKTKDFEKAEHTYRLLAAEGLQRENFEPFAQRAVYTLITILERLEKHAEIFAMVHELEDRADIEAGTWMTVLLHTYAVDGMLHAGLAWAATRCGRDTLSGCGNGVPPLAGMYRRAIRRARGEQSKFGAALFLKNFLAKLLWIHDGATPEDRSAALALWEEAMHSVLPESVMITAEVNAHSAWAREFASLHLTTALVETARRAGLVPLDDTAKTCMHRLRKLIQTNPSLGPDTTWSPEISLTRLHHLAGDDERARGTLREWLRLAFLETESGDGRIRADAWCRIAGSLQAMDDDVNAIAAWRMSSPLPSTEEERREGEADGEEREENDSQDSKTQGSEQGEDKRRNGNGIGETPFVTNAEPSLQASSNESAEPKTSVVTQSTTLDDSEEHSQEGHPTDENANNVVSTSVEVSASHNPPPHDRSANGSATPTVAVAGAATSPSPPPPPPPGSNEQEKLAGPLGMRCNGCGVEWNSTATVGAVYACKDCLDVQYDAACHARLRAGTLGMRICGAHHAFLRLPAFDRDAWEEVKAGNRIWVAGARVARTEWVEAIKREWGIDEPSVRRRERELRSARTIQRAWRWLRRRKEVGVPEMFMRWWITH